jgi:ATP-dependent Lon protease
MNNDPLNVDDNIARLLADMEPSDIESDDIEVSSDPEQTDPKMIPTELPILPLRGLVVYPLTALPLTIGQPRSIKLVDDISLGDRMVGLVTAKNPDLENPGPEDLYQVGTAAIVHRFFRAPDGTIRLLIQGLSRIKLGEFTQIEPYLKAKVTTIPETVDAGIEIEALARNCRSQFEHISDMIPSIPRELVSSVLAIQDPLQSVYNVANLQRMALLDAQELLEMDAVHEKLHKLLGLLTREAEVLELGQKIQNEARSEIEKIQRDYFLHEQMKAIQKELGESDEQAAEVESIKKKLADAQPNPEALDQANRELERISHLPPAAAEYGVIRSYLDWITALPWQESTKDDLEIGHARTILNQDHYGLTEIKDRILEYLAVRKLRLERKADLDQAPKDTLRKDREGVILCFIGPPGVGKTSLGQSIAHAMGRKFIRVSLGGVHDEAEIRGHRRTYIGAMPGRILQAIRRVGSNNPVFMLDEIDKLTLDFHGDPASALLEVLDPEQNDTFRDNYLEVPFDLSQVMFITTANQPDTIPQPLLDRMEIIHLSGYTEREKVEIAKKYLLPRQIHENGLLPGEIKVAPSAIQTIIRAYTREAGVRNLEREIGSICRKIATEISEKETSQVKITPASDENYLGKPHFLETEEINRRTSIPGVATGLAWTPYGGEILFIESTMMPGAKGFQITGSIGNVMQESARAALSYVRAHTGELKIAPDFFDKNDLHVHIPSGAQPKDGPSAGVTLVVSLVSLLQNRPVRHDVAMTGEITLRGQIMPVGGVKEKLLAAHRAGIKTVLLPELNLNDLKDLPQDIQDKMKFIGVDTVADVLKIAFTK